MKEFFSSDLHIGHFNIIEYCKRPYKSVEEMNEAIVSNWNRVVGADDVVYVLGDVCMGQLDKSIKYLARLNGTLRLVAGNHDAKSLKNPDFRDRFEWVRDYYETTLKVGSQSYHATMCHYPLASWNRAGRGGWMLHGHSHHTTRPGLPDTLDCGKILDVGLDGQGYGYAPVALQQIATIMNKKGRPEKNGEEM